MAQRDQFFSIKPFLPHAVLATLGVVAAPVLIAIALLALISPDPALVLVALGVVLLAIAAATAGTLMWRRKVESADIAFSDLMLWRWVRRRKAEEQLVEGVKLLGLDRSGQPVDDLEIHISPQQQLRVLRDLTAALESKDPYTHGHSQRVERHSYRTAVSMGMSPNEIEDLRKAAALHDVGKIRVPDRILRKAGELTIEERKIIEEHAVVGAWMVSSVGTADVISAVRHHHERYDGRGYPDGLAGDAIPLFARIIAVTDAYDAITSTRPYRASSGRDDAVDVLQAQSGSQFDPMVVDAFLSALPTRLPVATGLFLLLGGPERLFRQLAMWLRRFGAGTLTPAVGAAGAAVVLGASVFTPNVVETPRVDQASSETIQGEIEGSFEIGTSGDGARDDDATDKKGAGRDSKNRKPRREPKRNDGNGGGGGDGDDRINLASGADRDGASGRDGTQTNTTPNGNGGNDGPDGGNGKPDGQPTRSPSPQPSPSSQPPTPTETPNGGNDENPNDGRDKCKNDGNAGHGNDDKEC